MRIFVSLQCVYIYRYICMFIGIRFRLVRLISLDLDFPSLIIIFVSTIRHMSEVQSKCYKTVFANYLMDLNRKGDKYVPIRTRKRSHKHATMCFTLLLDYMFMTQISLPWLKRIGPDRRMNIWFMFFWDHMDFFS